MCYNTINTIESTCVLQYHQQYRKNICTQRKLSCLHKLFRCQLCINSSTDNCLSSLCAILTYSAGDLSSAWGLDSTESSQVAQLPPARINCFLASLSVTYFFLFSLSFFACIKSSDVNCLSSCAILIYSETPSGGWIQLAPSMCVRLHMAPGRCLNRHLAPQRCASPHLGLFHCLFQAGDLIFDYYLGCINNLYFVLFFLFNFIHNKQHIYNKQLQQH